MLGKFVIRMMWSSSDGSYHSVGFLCRYGPVVATQLRDARVFDTEADAWDYLISSGDRGEFGRSEETGEPYSWIEPYPYWVEVPYDYYDEYR